MSLSSYSRPFQNRVWVCERECLVWGKLIALELEFAGVGIGSWQWRLRGITQQHNGTRPAHPRAVYWYSRSLITVWSNSEMNCCVYPAT